jgi:hypothetical protein
MMLERHARYMPVMNQKVMMGVDQPVRRRQGGGGHKPELKKQDAQAYIRDWPEISDGKPD